jgi:hypothetical protein
MNEAVSIAKKHDTDKLEGLGVKYDTGKPRFDLIPTRPMVQLAEIYAYGAAKYADRNWEKGMEFSRVYAAAQRHLHAYWSGQDLDEESALPHLAHAAFGLLALLEFTTTHPELDDRP